MKSSTWLFAFGIILAGSIGLLLLRNGSAILQILLVAVVFVLAIGAGMSLRGQQ